MRVYPGSLSRVEAARAERAARAAEDAAGTAVLDLRKCCDHPQLTRIWRGQSREGQLNDGIILSIAEQNQRRADELQNKLQVFLRLFDSGRLSKMLFKRSFEEGDRGRNYRVLLLLAPGIITCYYSVLCGAARL